MTEENEHRPVGVVAAAEAGVAPDCAVCGPNTWPCPTSRTYPADFLTVHLTAGGSYVRLDRLTDGRVMCQLCFEYTAPEDLNPVEGGVEDVCKACAVKDAEQAAARAKDGRP